MCELAAPAEIQARRFMNVSRMCGQSGKRLRFAAADLYMAQERPKLPPSIHDWCLERSSSGSGPFFSCHCFGSRDWLVWYLSQTYFSETPCILQLEKEEEKGLGFGGGDDSGILSGAACLCFLVRYANFFPPFSLRQQLPTGAILHRLGFPSKLLRRFPRGCVVETAHRIATAPASVFVTAKKKTILRNCIFARVMSGSVMREEGRLQAAAAARIAGKSGVITAARSGDVVDVLSYLLTDEN